MARRALAIRGMTIMPLFAKKRVEGRNMQANLVATSPAREQHLRLSSAGLESGQGLPVRALAYLGAALFGLCFWAFVIALLF
jgi:hypothetical protein